MFLKKLSSILFNMRYVYLSLEVLFHVYEIQLWKILLINEDVYGAHSFLFLEKENIEHHNLS